MTKGPGPRGLFSLQRATIGVMAHQHENDHGTGISDAHEANLNVEGMTCASCVAHVEKALKSVPGAQDAQVNLARGFARVRFDPSKTDPTKLAEAVENSGY